MTSCGNHAGGCVSLDTTNSYPSLKHRYGLKCFCGDKVYLKSLELVKAVLETSNKHLISLPAC